MEVILLLIRLFLFGVFVLAGVTKLLDRPGSEKAVKDFGVSDDLAKPVAYALPIVEIVVGLSFLFVGTSWLASIGGLLLLLVFIGGMIYQMAQGNAPDCHCFGQIHSEPVGRSSLIRNIGFAILALLLAVQGSSGQGLDLTTSPNDMLQAVLILGILILLAIAVFYLKKILDQQLQITRRIEVLELVSRDGAVVERESAGNPGESLPIGSPFPEFEMATTGGQRVSLKDLIARKKPMLFVFVGPDCGPCNALYPEIKAWREELKDKLQFVLVSNGKLKANQEKFAGDPDILLQEKRELAEMVRVRWTPTSVYVNAEGKIASHTVAGDSGLRELVDKLRAEDLSDPFQHFASFNGIPKKIRMGNEVPEFEMTDLNGQPITQNTFKGKDSLVVFFSLTCPHCIRMMDELKEWDANKSENDPNLIVFSDGDPEAHRALNLKAPIVLDPNYDFAAKIGMHGTPSAVIINANGEIVTETGIGAPNVWALIGKHRPLEY
jgi:peroxiredoxin/uncharacterized membrane protein YphA (DoxX/SURF4 family)